MSENIYTSTESETIDRINYRPGIGAQLGLCFRRLLRKFAFRKEWRFLIYIFLASLFIALAVKDKYFISIESTLIGSSLTILAAMWIGALNSIQIICREKNGIRREKQEGMYLSAYVLASMLYQAILCLAETLIVVLTFLAFHVSFPSGGIVTPWFPFDFAVTLFLVIFASDMFALLISVFMASPVMAMAALPILLIIEIVFCGVFKPFLPSYTEPLQKISIASRGMEALNSEADYNSLPMEIIWDKIYEMRDSRFGGRTSLGKMLEMVQADNEVYHAVKTIRETEVGAVLTIEEVMEQLRNNPKFEPLREYEVMSLFKIGELLDMLHETGMLDYVKHYTVGANFTLAEIIDWLSTSPKLEYFRNVEFGSGVTVAQVLSFVGEDAVREYIEEKSAELIKIEDYVHSASYIGRRWLYLFLFALIYALALGVSLKLKTR